MNLKEIGSDDKKKRFVEVWSKEGIVASKEVTDVHGAFYNDGQSFDISDERGCSGAQITQSLFKINGVFRPPLDPLIL